MMKSFRGITSAPACTRTSFGRTGRTRSPSTASPIVAGHPATTAGCAPTTASSTSWPRRCRRRGARGAPGGRQPGHGPGPQRRRRRPCDAAAGGRAQLMRLRLRFQKLGKVRWTSHRDVARMWERACRRVQLPLAYTEGFSPRPKMHFGLALPTGAESVAEYLDLDLAEEADVDLERLPTLLSPALPAGVDVMA